MKLLVPVTPGGDDPLPIRDVLREIVAHVFPDFPAGGGNPAGRAWLRRHPAVRVDDVLFGALAALDYTEAPRLLLDLHRSGRLERNAYRLIGTLFLQAGPGAVASIGADRWKLLLRQGGFALHSRLSDPPGGTTLLYGSTGMPGGSTLNVMTTNPLLAAAYAGASEAQDEVVCLPADPRRVLAALSPVMSEECGWDCLSLHVLVDTNKATFLSAPADMEAVIAPCPCESDDLRASSWAGTSRLVNVPLPAAG